MKYIPYLGKTLFLIVFPGQLWVQLLVSNISPSIFVDLL